jgi:NADH-quinone oxidoreductase subunit M
MFWGPLDKKANMGLPDLNHREAIALAPLIFLVFWMGLFPSSILDSMRPSVATFIAQYDAGWREAYANDSTRLRPAPTPRGGDDEGGEGGRGEEGQGAAARAEGATPTNVLALLGGAR